MTMHATITMLPNEKFWRPV